MKSIITLLFPLLVLMAVSCDRPEEEIKQPYLSIFTDITCKPELPLKGTEPGPDRSCVDYSYVGDSLLIMKHYNAAFNCCPSDILVDFEIKGDSLIITEDDAREDCKCNCLYDVEIRVHNLSAGKYHVRFKEPYVLQDTTQIVFPVNLEKEPVGRFCVIREYYPYRW